MPHRSLRTICRAAFMLLAAAASLSVAAQEIRPPVAAVSPATPALSAALVKTGLYLIAGGGSNSLLRLSQSGAVLVDGKQAGTYRELRSQIRRINKLSDLPTRVLIVTDHHAHHSGNLPQFVAAGVAVLVQEKAKPRLPAVEAVAASAAPGARPPGVIVTFDRNYQLRIGGVEVHLHHFGNAHTDNDTVVHFPDLKVIAVGDLFTPDVPSPDVSAGGTLVGWRLVLEQVLKLDFDIVVPSLGPPATRADLVAFKGKLDTLVARAGSLVSQGVGKDQLLARLDTADLGWRLDFSAEQLDRLYSDLSRAR